MLHAIIGRVENQSVPDLSCTTWSKDTAVAQTPEWHSFITRRRKRITREMSKAGSIYPHSVLQEPILPESRGPSLTLYVHFFHICTQRIISHPLFSSFRAVYA